MGSKYISPIPIPPGETLEEELEVRGISQAELAVRMGMSPKQINLIIKGKAAMTAESAVKLEKVLGISAQFWMNSEASYRASLERQRQEREQAEEEKYLDLYPAKDMQEKGWLPKTKNPLVIIASLQRYFGVASLSAVPDVEAVAFRKAVKRQASPYAMAAWMRKGESEASTIETAPYERKTFIEALNAVKGISAAPEGNFSTRVRETCAAAGVAVVYVPHVQKTYVNGAARWITPQKALIQLSLRYQWADWFWFNFFHEAAHLLLHGTKRPFIDLPNGDDAKEEEEANAWASEFIISRRMWERFLDGVKYGVTGVHITNFAREARVSTGTVVGRLQHDGVIGYNQFNNLRTRFVFR